MKSPNTIERAVESAASGAVRAQTVPIRDRIEPPVDEFKEDSAERIENLADQVRALGRKLDRRDEAQVVARRLEKTADYLRYRPSGEVVSDAWDAVTRSRVLWVAGGAVAALFSLRLLQHGMRRDR
jgi:hypothetical protein